MHKVSAISFFKPRISVYLSKALFSQTIFLWLLTFKENKPKMNYPSTLQKSFWADLCVHQTQTASVWGETGKPPPPPFRWAAPMPPTDVVISHWNLNQTINIRQLSCSKKQRCLHNTACQNMLVGFTVRNGIGFWLSDTRLEMKKPMMNLFLLTAMQSLTL